ncbi:MAG: lysine--tRNA ligase [Phycisphaerales bacterium]
MQQEPGATHHLEQQRRENRAAAAALGLDPYGSAEPGLVTLGAARLAYDGAADEAFKAKGKEPGFAPPDRRPRVRVAGRVVLHRDNGKLIWMNLRDAGGEDLQVAASQRECSERGFSLAKLTDLGDLLVAEGPLVKTRTGEVTVWATDLRPAGKCLLPPPEKHAGLHDVELRYRQRYVDLWSNPETMRVFQQRSRLVGRVRRYLDERGFLEVETPMLQALAGGAAARPFVTHMKALDIDLFLRIAPELYLKRLLVGGLPRVYEVNRNFRNEGLDKQHNPEFTMLEVYEAYGDHTTMMALVEGLIRELATVVVIEREDRTAAPEDGRAVAPAGGPAPADELPTEVVLPFGELSIDYGRPFDRVSYAELFRRALGFDMTDAARAKGAIVERKLTRRVKGAALPPPQGLSDEQARAQLDRVDPVLLVNTLFEEVAEHTLDPARPTFITGYPAAISPLTRPSRADPAIADRADLFIAHMELAPMYTELNDPDVQAQRFREQLAGEDDEERTLRTFDEDFIRALKVGMPPAGGLGLGIDRLMMLLTNQRTIRDVMLFPLMRPE